MITTPCKIFSIDRKNGYFFINFAPNFGYLYNKYYHDFIDIPFISLRTALNTAIQCITTQHDDAERLGEGKFLQTYSTENVKPIVETIADIKAMEEEILAIEKYFGI